MKIIIILIVLLGCLPTSTLGATEEENAVRSEKKPGTAIPEHIESFLMRKLGMSSTGTIQVIGEYRLTHDSKLGKKSDNVLHVIQQDLFGGRLFWSCLVNVTQDRIQILYRCQSPDDWGAIMPVEKKK